MSCSESESHSAARWLICSADELSFLLCDYAKHIRTVLLSRFCLSVRLSVCPSVCPSDKRVYCDKTKAPSEKSSIMTNRKSHTSFAMSLRWTSYVAPNPQRGPQKRFFFILRIKMGFSRRKSAIKFLRVKTFSGKVVRHSLAYLSVHKWLVGDVPFDLKYWGKVIHPLQKRRLPINIRPYCDKRRWFSVKMWMIR